jgi:hypothetical protein
MPPTRSRFTLAAGLSLIGMGVLFLLQQALGVDVLGRLWPLFIVASGGLLLAGALSGGKQAASLAVPGSVVTVIGLILLVLSLTGRWHAWAYAWPLLLASVGVGLMVMGRQSDGLPLQRLGGALLRLGLSLFLLFGLFFELFIFGTPETARWGAPALLILLGAYLLLRGSGVLGRRRRAVQSTPASQVTLEGSAREDGEPGG